MIPFLPGLQRSALSFPGSTSEPRASLVLFRALEWERRSISWHDVRLLFPHGCSLLPTDDDPDRVLPWKEGARACYFVSLEARLSDLDEEDVRVVSAPCFVFGMDTEDESE